MNDKILITPEDIHSFRLVKYLDYNSKNINWNLYFKDELLAHFDDYEKCSKQLTELFTSLKKGKNIIYYIWKEIK